MPEEMVEHDLLSGKVATHVTPEEIAKHEKSYLKKALRSK